ncbi:hypothetical protein F5Y18DRAFT_158560 [Xylariaceae sp. FL1019]|nr:hypothetical protein F5Y18DRAFT_158560 [Xylariaceae sp. FL1019]
MVSQQSSPLRGRILAVCVVILVLFFLGSARPSLNLNGSPAAMSDPVVSALKVSVRQSSSSPSTLVLGVTNTHSSPVTLLRWDSPLDPSALKLGVLAFTPEGSDSSVEIPTIQIRRLMPPGDDQFVTIEPGHTEEREISLDNPIFPTDKLQGKGKVVCKGHWRSVWGSKKEDVSSEELKSPGTGQALTGAFESEPADFQI